MRWLSVLLVLLCWPMLAAAETRPLLGMYNGSANHIRTVEAILGRPLDFVTRYDDPSQWPTVWWEGAPRKDSPKIEYDVHIYPNGGNLKRAAAGDYDNLYHEVAARLRYHADRLIAVRIGSEMNLWTNDAPNFILAFRRFSKILKAAMPSVPITWNPNFGHNAEAFYPGDEYCDIVGMDIYMEAKWFPGDAETRWRAILSGQGGGNGFDWLASFAAQHHKQIAFPEWGDTIGDGSFIQHLHDWMLDKAIAYHAYWDSADAITGSSALMHHHTNQVTYIKLWGRPGR